MWFNTKVPKDELGIWNYKFMMTMIPEIEGFDASLLDNPIGKIQYVEKVGEFDYDEDYTFSMLKKLEALMKEYEKARKEEYKKMIVKADAAFESKQYDAAIELYDKAIDLDSYEPYPDDQIFMIGKILQEDVNAQKNYDENIKLADGLYQQKDYINSKKYYNRALKYMDKTYPKDQIVLIDGILNNTDALLADQAAKEKAYIEAVAAGDRNFTAKQYEVALGKFTEATTIKPNEKYPKDKIAELNLIIAQLAKDNKSKEEIEKAYREAIAQADAGFGKKDYENARTIYVKASQIKPSETYPKTKIAEIDNLLAANKSVDEKYKGFIAVADKSFVAKEYESAVSNYKQALSIKPNEAYPAQRIKEIEALMLILAQQKQKDVDGNYAKLIAAADASMNKKEYENAKNNYTQALALKNNEAYPKQRLAEIESIMAELANKKRNYDLAIARADNNFNIDKLQEAKVDYQQALAIFPTEQYPQTRINEIENKLLALKSADEQRLARENAYKNAIVQADAYFAEKKYQESKNSYSQALSIKPDEAYPKQKIAEIDQLIMAQKGVDDKYNVIIATADQQFLIQNYTEAKVTYTNALQIKPAEAYPKQKIAEIDKLLLAQKDNESRYNAIIASADQLFLNKKYTDAKVTYTNALAIKSAEAYPKQKIAEIDQLLLAQKDIDGKYNAIIATADQLLLNKKYADAKVTYTNALTLKSEEAYPKQKIAEIDQILAATNALDERYKAMIATADQHFINEKYDEAKATYTNALQLKPTEAYPKQKISEIDVLLAQLLAAKIKYESNKKQYDQIILQADVQFNAKVYTQAKTLYQQASTLLPSEVYPKQRMVEIDNLIAGAAESDKKYAEAIATADQKLAAKLYSDAIVFYNQASVVKPAENYPKQKVIEINKLIEDQQKNEVAYTNYIKLADAAFSSNNLESAKGQYQAALSIKPTEVYPTQRITEIDKLLSEKARMASDLEKLESQYKTLITNADVNFNQKNYPQAKTIYAQALQLKPAEMYPKDRMAEIDKIISTLEAQQKAYDQKMAEAGNLYTANNFNGALAAYQQAAQLKPEEVLPRQKISEIQTIISANTKKQEQYQGLITQADNAFNQKNYAAAKPLYQQASGVMPTEVYPKNQISKIDMLIADIAIHEAELQALIKSYKAKIAEADKLFTAQNYNDALTAYMDAKIIKSDETYPDQQIAKINQISKANAAQLEANYNNAIKQGDQFKASKTYVEARNQYTIALGLKPNDAIAKAKIVETDNLIEQERLANEKQSKIDAEYNKFISQADAALQGKNYPAAISLYKNAQSIKAAEKYPKDQIELCEKKIQEDKALAAAEAEKRRQAELAASQGSFDKKEFDYTGEQRDNKFLSELSKQYPEGVTTENYDKPNKKIKRVIVNHNGIAKEYVEVTYSYGTYYFRNGQNISQSIFYSEIKK